MSNGEGAVAANKQRGVDEPDGLQAALLQVLSNTQADVRLPQRTRQSFRSLDRSLKAFLRSSNLPGLEYRLRLAGYNTLSDLLDADLDTLCAHGFTPLMARRLLNALHEYLIRHLDRSQGMKLPFQLVRKGQKIKSDPTEKMKALPTFGKRNVKRQGLNELPKMAKKRTASSKGPKVTTPKQPVSYIRLMSEENLPSEPIFPNVLSGDVFSGEVEEGAGPGEEDRRGSLAEEVGIGATVESAVMTQEPVSPVTPVSPVAAPISPLPIVSPVSPSPVGEDVWKKYRRSVPVFQEFYLPDAVDSGDRWPGSEEMGRKLKRCNSVPADYRFHDNRSTPLGSWCMMVRSYSSPSSLAVPPSQIENTLAKLCTSQDLAVVIATLKSLFSSVQDSGEKRREVREKGGVEVIVDLLVSLCTNPRVVDSCLKLLGCLTRGDVVDDTLPVETVSAVLQAVECHPASQKTLIQGCLALGNIGRTAPSLSEQLLSDHALGCLGAVMETFPSSPNVQISAMSALAVGLGRCPEGRLRLLAEHGKLLDLVLVAMESFPEEEQLQECACSFMALLTAEVAVEMESGVVQLMVEHVCIAMAMHGRSAAVAVWAAKALSNASANAALSDSKLAGRCGDLLAEALATFPSDPQVWTWSLYALLQLVSAYGAVKHELVRGGVVSLLKTPPHDIPEYAMQYLERLLTTLN